MFNRIFIEEFLRESNAIEGVFSESALRDSMHAWAALSKESCLSKETLLSAHFHLMRNLDPEIAGKFRTCNVRVGTRICPEWELVEGEIGDLLAEEPRTALGALRWHVNFELVHPFQDGNGRAGRLVYLFHCNLHSVHPMIFREKDRLGYYALFEKC